MLLYSNNTNFIKMLLSIYKNRWMNIIYHSYGKFLTTYLLDYTIINMTNCISKTDSDHNTLNHTLNPI